MLNFGEGRFYDRMRYVCMYVYVCIAAVHHRKSGNKGKQLVKLFSPVTEKENMQSFIQTDIVSILYWKKN